MWGTLNPEFLARLPHPPMNGAVAGAAVAAAPTTDWETCIAELNHYRTLSDDWDGQGAILGKPAAPILGDVVDCAVALMRSLRAYSVPAPMPPPPACVGLSGFRGTSRAAARSTSRFPTPARRTCTSSRRTAR
jgi:hypothetical protein